MNKRIRSRTIGAFICVLVSLQSQDVARPTIDSITSATDDGAYGIGSGIDVTVNFSEEVSLSDGGIVRISLNTGVANTSIEIGSITDATSASSVYTVQAGDSSSDLSVSSVSLAASDPTIGATLQDGAGNIMLDFSIPSDGNLDDFKEIRIDGFAPEAPSGLSASPSDGAVTLEWNRNSESDFSKYRIFAGISSTPTTVVDSTTAATDTTKTFSNLDNDTTYYYRLTCIDSLGNESDYSDEKAATPFSPPSAGNIRDGLSADVDWTNSPDSLSANWDVFVDNGTVTYQYAVGISAVDDIVGWNNVGLDISVAVLGLNLFEGFTYQVSVRGTDYTLASDTATTDGITIDFASPSAGTVNDGPLVDLTFTASDTSLSANWTGFSDDASGIDFYDYAIGDSPGDTNVVTWTNTGPNTTATNSDTTFHDGVTYYFSVRAVDVAGNTSDAATSDGVTVDVSPPIPGNVIDALAEDSDWTTDSTSLSASWYGFSDELSGIDYYEFALGSDSGGTDLVSWFNIGVDSSVILTNLSLRDSATYYFSVRATDEVGNVSSASISNGITVDISPPSVLSLVPSMETPLKLTENSDIIITFSEVIETLLVEVVPSLMSTVQYQVNRSDDQVTLTVEAPLASLDTISLSLKNVTDLRGLVANDTVYEYHTALLADFNADYEVDITDLTEFVSLWPDVDIGPVTGEIPHFIPDLDGETNLRDGMTFARMWRWSHDQNDSLILARAFTGEEPEISQSRHGLAIHLPEGVSTGEIALQYPQFKMNIDMATENLSSKEILISTKRAELGQILVDFGYFEDKDGKEVELVIEHFDKSSSNILLSYIFYSADKNIVSMGTKSLNTRTVPEEFELHQNYPNPFNPTTTILYDLPENSQVELVIYDILGRQVRTLLHEGKMAGYHSATWDGKDGIGLPVGTGVYIYRIHAREADDATYSRARKMLMLR
ncbi:MAG: FlgD immunoglobulin-like domain containing protein [Candidatus Neomarinimicrobiota bacterium]